MKRSRITTKGDTTIDKCFYENNNRRFHATWLWKCCTKCSRYFSVHRMRNKRERDEIDCIRGYIANSLGQTGNINSNVTLVSFRWGIVATCSFSNFRHFKLVPYNKTHRARWWHCSCLSDCTSVRLHPCNACNCH